jgi:hypothetical protein
MKAITLVLALLVAACTAATPSGRLIPMGPEPEQLEAGFDRAAIERDLLLTARHRVGEAAIRRALAADGYIFAKYYPGMMAPPPPGMPHDWRPKFPFVLLFQEDGRWFVATDSGVRTANPSSVAKIGALLSDDAFWRQPNWTPPQCTDAGASLVMIKRKARPEALRRGSCGATELTQRLVTAALEA